jgi:hypothetical protein
MSDSQARADALSIDDILQYFEDTYEALHAESGYGLGPDALEDARRQVLMYWYKLRDKVASRVTETEVPLTLMNQITPQDVKYSIHGVVDVVEEKDEITLYDIKSHDVDYILQNRELYAPQLEVYAHIWSTLRGKAVHRTCIIATDPPAAVKQIKNMRQMSPAERQAFDEWQPVVEIDFNQNRMQQTIAHFGEIIDKIESRQFAPPTVARLKKMWQERGTQMICSKCDARYSCNAYRGFVSAQDGVNAARLMEIYFDAGMDATERQDQLERATENSDEAR